MDEQYDLLKCELEHVAHSSKEFKMIKEYVDNTSSYYKLGLTDVWKVERHLEVTLHSIGLPLNKTLGLDHVKRGYNI